MAKTIGTMKKVHSFGFIVLYSSYEGALCQSVANKFGMAVYCIASATPNCFEVKTQFACVLSNKRYWDIRYYIEGYVAGTK